MTPKEHQKNRVEGVRKAINAGYSQAGIARVIGASRTNLASIVSRYAPYSKYGERLDTWLRERGFWPDEPAAQSVATNPAPMFRDSHPKAAQRRRERVPYLTDQCPKCGDLTVDPAEGAQRCMMCGADLWVECSHCGEGNEFYRATCSNPKCRRSLRPATPEPEKPMEF